MKVRPTTSTLLALIAAIGLGLAALRASSGPWMMAAWLASFGVVSFATVGAVLAPSPRRRVWLGAAIFGWGYYFVTGQVPFAEQNGSMQTAIRHIYEQIHPRPPIPSQPTDPLAYMKWYQEKESVGSVQYKRATRFTGTMIALLALPVMVAGGLAARAFEPRPIPSPSDPSAIRENLPRDNP